MVKLLIQTFKIGPVMLGAFLLVASGSASAQTPTSEVVDGKSNIANNSLEVFDGELVTLADNSLEVADEESITLADNSLEVVEESVTLADNSLAEQPASAEPDVLDQVENYSDGLNEQDSVGQVTNVEQLRDVSPTDWAYEALRSVVERYGCIEGYPDQTYRGNRALTRY